VGGTCGMHGEGEKMYKGWWESPKESEHSEDRGRDGRMGSEWILGRVTGGCGVDSVGSGQKLVTGSYE
jgi:hypothetical protein